MSVLDIVRPFSLDAACRVEIGRVTFLLLKQESRLLQYLCSFNVHRTKISRIFFQLVKSLLLYDPSADVLDDFLV